MILVPGTLAHQVDHVKISSDLELMQLRHASSSCSVCSMVDVSPEPDPQSICSGGPNMPIKDRGSGPAVIISQREFGIDAPKPGNPQPQTHW